jgi:hypothetical protein
MMLNSKQTSLVKDGSALEEALLALIWLPIAILAL